MAVTCLSSAQDAISAPPEPGVSRVHMAVTGHTVVALLYFGKDAQHGLCFFQGAVLSHTCASADVGGVLGACLTRTFYQFFIYSELYLERGQRNMGPERPSSPHLEPLQEDLHASLLSSWRPCHEDCL